MVESVNAASGAHAASGVTGVRQNKQGSTVKNIPVVDESKLSPEQKVAVESLKKQIAAGHVEYVDTNLLEDVLNLIMDKKCGDYIRITNFADPNTPLNFGEAKRILKLNLPPGSLRCNKTESGGGDFDRYSVPTINGQYYLDIFIDDLKEGTGLTKQEIKDLCNNR